jgi:predicted metal-binding protein
MVLNPEPSVKIPNTKAIEPEGDNLQDSIDELLELAMSLGSNAVTIVDSISIQIEEQLADLCREARCPNYGLSPTCPPHIKGPVWLKKYIRKTPQAILIEIRVPQELMYSDQRKEIGKLLHFIVIQVEQTAREKGLVKSISFAGGSCKNLQCSEHASCNVLHGDGNCRYPNQSRPSVSGYGINMNHLLTHVGWSQNNNDSSIPTSSRYGLVLLG